VPRPVRACRRKDSEIGPWWRVRPGEIGGEAIARRRKFGCGLPDHARPQDGGRRLPQSTGAHLLPEPRHPPVRPKHDMRDHPAAADRADLGDARVRARKRSLVWDGARKTQDRGVIEMFGHWGRR